jgi:hypothetical protein
MVREYSPVLINNNTDYDVIIVHTQRLYEIPHERRTGTQTKIGGGQTRMQKYLKSFIPHMLTSRTSKTWQLVAKSIKVIDKSDEAIEPRYQPILPTTEKHKSSPSVTAFAVQKRMRPGK